MALNFDDAADSVANTLERIAEDLNEYGQNVHNGILTREQIIARSIIEQNETDQIAKRNIEKLKSTVDNYSKRMISTLGGMTTQEGAYRAMGDASAAAVSGLTKATGFIVGLVPGLQGIGTVISGLGEAAGEVVKLISQETGKAFTAFEKISGSGIVSSFDDMRDTARRTGLLYSQLDEVLSKNSETMAIFAGTTLAGSETFKNVLEKNKETAVKAQKMGINFTEYSEMQSSYIAQQMRGGFSRNKSDIQLAAEADNYAYEIDKLSKLTGKKREALVKEQEDLQKDTKFRIAQEQFKREFGEKEGAKLAERAKITYSSLIGEVAQKGFLEMLTTGGKAIGPNAQAWAVQMGIGGENLEKLVQQFRNGNLTQQEFIETINQGSKKFVDKTLSTAAVLQDKNNIVTQGYVSNMDMAQRANNSIKEATTEIENTQTTVKERTDATAEVAAKSQKIAREMEDLLTSGKAVAKLNNLTGAAMQTLIGKINDFTSDTRSGSSSASPRTPMGIGRGSSPVAPPSALQRPAAVAPMAPVAPPVAPPPAPTASPVAPPPTPTATAGGNSTPRTGEMTDSHQDGVAIDVGRQGLAMLEQSGLLGKYGFRSGNTFSTPDPVHIQDIGWSPPKAAKGAIVTPTPGGSLYQVGEGGQSEAIIPMPDGRSVPVSFIPGGEQSNAIVEIVDQMTNKLDNILNIMSRGNKIQTNISNAMM
jgi:hypothetical protein